MKKVFFILFSFLLVFACDDKTKQENLPSTNLQSVKLKKKLSDSLLTGSTYLSVYSQVYSTTEHKTNDLTATVSIRNLNKRDTVYVTKANYFDTKGDLVKSYIKEPIFVKPLQTIEIIIDEKDATGGTGAKFVFDWSAAKNVQAPYFEAIMVTTYGQQGLSFTTQGIPITE
ncbi:uncharacterized protein DUF3124 [Oceanihabitans sediminis]|uniref:DUF3124 domain-containing protein n=1 Tax=Oceanihabitans sediminis TaxID=1812012 RepID=A0A368P4C5_9FLAO|nr:DUF3124 domain-containing protein [Oceanihabitans sediminis]MDX1773302.1 DUF3124 domain-containing protein [Oceanihabitans sediminis]RBP32733.1 uncharacterized protein DUF3124 [Oceanihabitans sediminis]RCU57727.1 DUF3124 domain-containing protein [Oceanihabitans sediminis]